MLKRLIENWLTSLSEREFDIPFRLLLEAEDHISIAHRTVHGGMELGKDIASWKPDENLYYFFQLKSGDATLSDWNEMERQIRQMVEVPYVHPNYRDGDPYKPVWVCTGQLGEPVRLSLGLENDRYRREGKPPVEVWERNTLINKYHSTFFDLVFVDEVSTIEFLRLWSSVGDYMSDENELRAFFQGYLCTLPLGTSERKMRRHLATFSLIVAQLSQRYISRGGLYSAIDCTLLALTQLYHRVAVHSLVEGVYRSSLDVVLELATFYLRQLVDECDEDKEMLQDLTEPAAGLSDIFELPLRVHGLASKIALYSLLRSLAGLDTSRESEILGEVLASNPVFCNVVSERQMGTFWLSVVALLKGGHRPLAENYVANTFRQFIGFHEEGKTGLPDPYRPYQIAISHHLGVETLDVRSIDMRRQSYFLPILLKFILHLGLRDLLAEHWYAVSHMVYREYVPSNTEELFAYLPSGGRSTLNNFDTTGSWSQLSDVYSERLMPEVTKFVERHPEALLVLTLTYPWRAQWREVERYV